MKRNKFDKEKCKMYSLRREEAPGNALLEPSAVLKEIKCLKESLLLKGIKGVVTSGQDPTQLSFQPVERN